VNKNLNYTRPLQRCSSIRESLGKAGCNGERNPEKGLEKALKRGGALSDFIGLAADLVCDRCGDWGGGRAGT